MLRHNINSATNVFWFFCFSSAALLQTRQPGRDENNDASGPAFQNKTATCFIGNVVNIT